MHTPHHEILSFIPRPHSATNFELQVGKYTVSYLVISVLTMHAVSSLAETDYVNEDK